MTLCILHSEVDVVLSSLAFSGNRHLLFEGQLARFPIEIVHFYFLLFVTVELDFNLFHFGDRLYVGRESDFSVHRTLHLVYLEIGYLRCFGVDGFLFQRDFRTDKVNLFLLVLDDDEALVLALGECLGEVDVLVERGVQHADVLAVGVGLLDDILPVFGEYDFNGLYL